MEAITVRALRWHIGPVEVLRGIDLTVAQGEVVAVLGPGGSGKTTTTDLVLGLATPTGGDVSVFGMPPRQAVARGLVSAVLRGDALLEDLTVRESVEYVAALFEHHRPVPEVLEVAGLTRSAGRRISTCSAGRRQRTRFAMALVPDPELIVLDEPTTGIDLLARRGLWRTIRADAGRGRTVLFTTCDRQEAETYADRVVHLREGRVVADGVAADAGPQDLR